jgi:hypothetical protein
MWPFQDPKELVTLKAAIEGWALGDLIDTDTLAEVRPWAEMATPVATSGYE